MHFQTLATYFVFGERSQIGHRLVEGTVGLLPRTAIVAGYGALRIHIDNEGIRIGRPVRHDVRLRHRIRAHSRFLCKKVALDVQLRRKQYFGGQCAQGHTSCTEIRAGSGWFPEIRHVRQFPVHTGKSRHTGRLKVGRQSGGLVRAVVVVGQLYHFLLQRIVPHGIVRSRQGSIHKTHLVYGRIAGIHRHVASFYVITP